MCQLRVPILPVGLLPVAIPPMELMPLELLPIKSVTDQDMFFEQGNVSYKLTDSMKYLKSFIRFLQHYCNAVGYIQNHNNLDRMTIKFEFRYFLIVFGLKAKRKKIGKLQLLDRIK